VIEPNNESGLGLGSDTAPIEPPTEPYTEPDIDPDDEPYTEPYTDPDDEPYTDPDGDPYTDPYTQPDDQGQAATFPPAQQNHAWVHIPQNIGSTQIAQILQQAGIITNTQAFLSFLAAQGFNAGLMAGDFMLPLGADFNVIMDSILAQGFR
jgi:hypothetical protein